jgi:hypothetical protein
LLPIINPHNSSPAPTLPGVVVAALNRPLTWSFAHTTTSSTTLSSTAVSSDMVKVSVITTGTYSMARFSTTT